MEREYPQLSIIGDVGVDLVMGSIGEWPQIGTEMILPRSEMRAGGSAANAALVLRHLGQRVHLISAVGQDHFGSWLAGQLQGIDVDLQVCASATTLSVGLMHACGERNFFTTKGHLELMTLAHVLAHVPQTPLTGSIALLTGVFLLPGLRVGYLDLLNELATRGYQVALDTGWPSQGWGDAIRAEVLGWLNHCDHLLLNELELLNLAGSGEVEPAMRLIAAQLKPGASLIVKAGARGALGMQHGSLLRQPVEAAAIFDTIGAGDTFNAGYLAARAQGADLAGALATACHVARSILPRFPRGEIRPGEYDACLTNHHMTLGQRHEA